MTRPMSRIREDIATRQAELRRTSEALYAAQKDGNRREIVRMSCQKGYLQRSLKCLAAEAERALEAQEV